MTDAKREWVTKVPRDETTKRELLGMKPPAWEYLLFAAELRSRRVQIEPKWRDYSLGYSMTVGPRVRKEDLAREFSERISRMTFMARNIERIISMPAQVTAFGEPGEPGDPELIQHMAGRLMQVYEQLIDWATEMRSLRVPDSAERLPEMAVGLVAQPIEEVRRFIERFIQSLETGLTAVAADESVPLNIEMQLTFEMDDKLAKEWAKELKRAVR